MAMYRDLTSNLDADHSLGAAAHTASANGTGVDLRGADSAMVVINAGAWTDGTHTITLEESDDDATYTDVADADISGTEPVIDGAADDDTTYQFGYSGAKRYVRVITTVAGATSGAVYGASVVRGDLHRAPTEVG